MSRKKRNIRKSRSQIDRFISFAVLTILGSVIICAVYFIVCSQNISEDTLGHDVIVEEPISELKSSISDDFIDETEENCEEAVSNEVLSESEQKVKTEIQISEENVEDILAEMSLEDKVLQMFIITPEQLTGLGTVTAAGNTTKESLQKYPVGGLIYFTPNLLNYNQTSEMLNNSQKFAIEIEKIPLFLCVDEEGGRVARVANNSAFGLNRIKPMNDVESAEEAYEIGSTIGEYLSELGFNVDFAPDADVLTNPENTVIGDRSFGDDPVLVANYAISYADGLHSCGVLSTFKHFPGHGASTDDTHHGVAYTNKTLEELEQSELIPFMLAQNENIDMVMVSHISVPEILGNNTPCTLSQYMVTNVLCEKLGYEGLIITDAMNMGAITSNYDNDQAVVEAIKAGCDLILTPVDFKGAKNAVVAAVESGELSINTIDESVKKIIVKKLWLMKEEL